MNSAYWLKFVFSNQFLAFLGIFPIIIGLKKLLDYYKQENAQYLSFQNDKINQKDEISGEKAGKIEENHYYIENIEKFHPQTSFLKKKYGYSSALAVSLIKISNGGDNIGIYAQLFASYDK